MAKIKLVHGDNFSFVGDGEIDLVLTDPPFNISKDTNFATFKGNTVHSYNFDKGSSKKWDTVGHTDFLQLLDQWAVDWHRVLKKGGSFVVFCGDSYISHLWESLTRAGLCPSRVFVWRKNNAVPVNRKYVPMSANEYVIVGVKKGGKRTFNSTIPLSRINLSDNKVIESAIVADKVGSIVNRSVFKELDFSAPGLFSEDHVDDIVAKVFNAIESSKKGIEDKVRGIYRSTDNDVDFHACVPNGIEFPLKTGKRIHPTQKSHALLQYFIALFSNPGDTILDGFAGSGSTAYAAYTLERNTVLVEREESFFKESSLWLADLAGNDFESIQS